MKKTVLGIAAALLVVAMLVTPVMATKPRPVSGKWGGSGAIFSNIRHAGGNGFATVTLPNGLYTQGDILGTFTQVLESEVHYGDPAVPESLLSIPPAQWPEAPFNWKINRVFTGTVLGVSGGFTMKLEAKGYGNTMGGPTKWDLVGTWVVISGTGGLAGLHGQGTWWHSRTGFAWLEYEGQVHFDP